jgi:gamma-glutamylcyclotransferase
MDAHFDQVMRLRAELAGQPAAPRRYFAYSTVLDRTAFEAWRAEHGYGSFNLPEGPVAEAVDVDLVYDFPSRWWGGRVAGLVDRPGASVFGRLFTVAGVDWPIVQHKEGGVTGMSVERPVWVLAGGERLEATAFTTNPARASLDGPVSPRFVEALVRGARAAGLPEGYVARLAASAG